MRLPGLPERRLLGTCSPDRCAAPPPGHPPPAGRLTRLKLLQLLPQFALQRQRFLRF
ncbi:hypothetical protein TUM17559_21680 [Enterobacter cloacae]|nr:hypothetical protein TUM17559_21680 [Enterobacter cloacae]GJL11704.1 hypothetical protein TUM17572_15110 [Klebsiella oxytoca]